MNFLNILNPIYISKNRSEIFSIIHNYFNKLGIPLNKNERRITALRNIHKGKRAFIIGTGPSLKISDLDKLKNEITFAFNRIYLAFNMTHFRPRYYLVFDSLVIEQSYKEINKLEGFFKIYPKDKSKLAIDKKTIILNPWEEKSSSFSTNLLSYVFIVETVTTVALQLAFYMGIKEIFLLGMDFDYNSLNKQQNKTKRAVTSDGTVDHFLPNYRKKGDIWNLPDLDTMKKEFLTVKSIFKQDSRTIYNATRGGKLEIFPRVEFDSLF